MISNLRRRLTVEDADLIQSRPGGYELRLGTHELDLETFRELVERAHRVAADGDRGAAAATFAEALALWRGPALADVPDALVAGTRQALEEERLAALESSLDILVSLGRHRTALRELACLLTEHPYREGLHEKQMLALLAAGRRVDALDHYREVYRRFAEDLGVAPGPVLRDLEQRILNGETVQPGSRHRRAAAPAQLPSDVAGFTGREAELARLLPVSPTAGRKSLRIHAIDGMAGVGKTALAIHAAHLLASRFPDGQLFVDLHGHTPDLAPVEPHTALDQMLQALGSTGEEIPHALDARAALLRSRLAGRRVLVVLDDAADEAQVQPLLPGSADCLVLITSRHRLTGLDGAIPLSLDVLAPAAAVTLFTSTAARAEQAGEPVAEIVELCGRLPLALRIAAARLRHRPAWTPDHLAGLLRDERSRLAELEAGPRSVSATFQLSYRDLTGEAQDMFARLGLHPGPDIGVHAAAALAGTTVRQAARLLEHLVDTHLLVQHRTDRYRFHDLVGIYAAQLTNADTGVRAAAGRLLDHYVHAAAVATEMLYPYEFERCPAEFLTTAVPDLTDQARAMAWLAAELPNLLAAARYAAANEWPAHTTALSAILRRHLRVQAHGREAEALHQAAVRTATLTGDQAGLYAAHYGLGGAAFLQGRNDDAAHQYERALAVAAHDGNRRGEMRVQHSLGMIHYLRARHGQAARCFEHSIRLAEDLGDRNGSQAALHGLGMTEYLQSHFDRAARYLEQAREIAHDIGNSSAELAALYSLGNVHRQQSRPEAAVSCYERALAMARDAGSRAGEGAAWRGLAEMYRVQRKPELAAGHVARALDIARDLNDANSEFEALLGLARVHRDTGDNAAALTVNRQALTIAERLDQPTDQVRAHDALARIHLTLEQPSEAHHYWRQALTILTTIDLTNVNDITANDIRTQLAALNPGDSSHRS